MVNFQGFQNFSTTLVIYRSQGNAWYLVLVHFDIYMGGKICLKGENNIFIAIFYYIQLVWPGLLF